MPQDLSRPFEELVTETQSLLCPPVASHNTVVRNAPAVPWTPEVRGSLGRRALQRSCQLDPRGAALEYGILASNCTELLELNKGLTDCYTLTHTQIHTNAHKPAPSLTRGPSVRSRRSATRR